MPGGPPTYSSKEEEQRIESKKSLARERIADAYVDKLEEILNQSSPETQSSIARALHYTRDGFVYGYNPAEMRINKLIWKYSGNYEQVEQEIEKIKVDLWRTTFLGD